MSVGRTLTFWLWAFHSLSLFPTPNFKQYFVRFYPFQWKTCLWQINMCQTQHNFNQRISNKLFLLWWNNHHDKDEGDVKRLRKQLIVQLLLTLVNYTTSLWKSHLWGMLLLLFFYFLTVFLTCLDIFMSPILLNCPLQLSLIFLLLPFFTLLTTLTNFYFHIACSLVVYCIFFLPPALHFSPIYFLR